MEVKIDYENKKKSESNVILIPGYLKNVTTKKDKKSENKKVLDTSSWPKEFKLAYEKLSSKDAFTSRPGELASFHLEDGTLIVCIGMGDKKKNYEDIRKNVSIAYKVLENRGLKTLSFDVDTFHFGSNLPVTVYTLAEAIYLASYKYLKYKKIDFTPPATIYLSTKSKSNKKLDESLEKAKIVTDSVNVVRTLVNHPPNFLNSEVFADEVVKDAKENLKGIKVKVLNKAEIKKENMNMLLAVNAGSAFEPRVVHLTYTPKKKSRGSKHFALVGKGLTFDTGGYCLKPSTSINNMKFDMAGAATVYGAFRAAALLGCEHTLTCVLGMTDNSISSNAYLPDAIITSRAGKHVEILNTDAEGRLVLGDCLDYVCDLKPDAIIDAATLTGACVVALGNEVCGILGNNKELTNKILKVADEVPERMWPLPIFDEYRNDIKSKIGDIKNLGSNRNAGTAKAAAFLECFIKDQIPWAHLDIAGIADNQAYLPYCPSHGPSGLVTRTLIQFLMRA